MGGIYLQSLLQAPARILRLALPIPVAVAVVWWCEGRVHLARPRRDYLPKALARLASRDNARSQGTLACPSRRGATL